MKSVLFLSVFFLISVVLTGIASGSRKSYKVVCYSRSWANEKPGDFMFTIKDIDPNLCTHLVYSYAILEDNKITALKPSFDLNENSGLGAYQRFNALKRNNTSLKTLIALGGFTRGSDKFSQMTASRGTRRTFIGSVLQFLEEHGFDGLDLDLEDPNAEYANGNGTMQDKYNFGYLIGEIWGKFQSRGFLLTATVSAKKEIIDSVYDIENYARYFNFINLLAYDFHERSKLSTGHNAPLYSRPNELEADQTLNVNYSVSYWLEKEFPADKLILGMPFYGRGFILQDPKKNGLDAPVTRERMRGHYSRSPGEIGYNEICRMLINERGWKEVFEPNILAPYAFKNREWIGFDNIISIIEKVKYLKDMTLGGAMVWALDYDDFRRQCHNKRYPLLKTINRSLGRRFG